MAELYAVDVANEILGLVMNSGSGLQNMRNSIEPAFSFDAQR